MMGSAQATVELDKAVQTLHLESIGDDEKSRPVGDINLVYSDVDTEPEIHLRTYIAVAAMLFLNYVQVIALQGPPVVVSSQVESACVLYRLIVDS